LSHDFLKEVADMDKATLRQQTIQALSQMPADQRQAASERLYQALWASPQWRSAQTVATTLSSAIELNTQPIIARAQAEGKTWRCPRRARTGKWRFGR
jgi:5-formyltetrahydrofolate cyclo-ligase